MPVENSPQLSPELIEKLQSTFAQMEPFRRRFVRARDDQEFSEQLDFAHIATLVDISQPTEVLSHRPYLGPVIVWLKRTAMRVASPLIRVLLRRQIELNEYLFHCAIETSRQSERIKQLENEITALKEERRS